MDVPLVIDVILPACNKSRSFRKVIQDISFGRVRDIIGFDHRSTLDKTLQKRASGEFCHFQPIYDNGIACPPEIEFYKPVGGHFNLEEIDFPNAVYTGDLRNRPLISETMHIDRLNTESTIARAMVSVFKNMLNIACCNLIINRLRLLYEKRLIHFVPPRCIRRKKPFPFDMTYQNCGWMIPSQARALQNNLHCAEVPVSCRKRTGSSKIRDKVEVAFLAGYKILWTIFKWI